MIHEQGSDSSPEDETEQASGRDRSTESQPTSSGHSTADDQTTRNEENESPG